MKIVGHRGARGLAPENTLVAIKKALEHHVDEIEFDLRVTKDGVVVLHHDEFLTDPDGQRRDIDEMTYKELLAHKSDTATLKQAFEVAGKNTVLYIEVKPYVKTAPIIKIIKDYYGRGWHNLMLASFSQETLLELHKALLELPTVVLERWSSLQARRRASQLGTKFISMDERWLWWGFIAAMGKSGWKLYAYTLNDPAKAERWARHGLYGVVTDYPDLFEAKRQGMHV